MYPRGFDYVAPTTLEEAVDALQGDEFAKVIAGGMSLIPLMKLRLLSPDLLVDISRIDGLSSIADHEDSVRIGALVKHHQTAEHPGVPAGLRTAASWTGDVQVRNRGTTCGAVAHADVVGDQPAAVLALDGTMLARSKQGTREIGASDFFVDALTSALAPDEILTEIRIPKDGGSSAYDKIGRRGGHTDYAVAGAAAWVNVSDGHVIDCRVALTGVGTKPALSHTAAAAFIGTDGSELAVAEASSAAIEDATIIEDLYGSVEYKSHLAKVMVRRALTEAVADRGR